MIVWRRSKGKTRLRETTKLTELPALLHLTRNRDKKIQREMARIFYFAFSPSPFSRKCERIALISFDERAFRLSRRRGAAQMRTFKGSEPSRTPHRGYLRSFFSWSVFRVDGEGVGEGEKRGRAPSLHPLGDLPRFTSLKRCRGY